MSSNFRYTWGDTVFVTRTAPQELHPGETGSVCGMRETEGANLYLIEFKNGDALEVQEHQLRPATNVGPDEPSHVNCTKHSEDENIADIKMALTRAVLDGRFSIESARLIKKSGWRSALKAFPTEIKIEAESLFYFIEGFEEEVNEGYVDAEEDPELYGRILKLLKKL
jgi:hypothetical protein